MSSNPESILDTVKKALGFDSEYTAFDLDITMFINASFGALQQLGVGGDGGFFISDNTTLWSQYVTDMGMLGMIQTYIFMSARIVFDTPDRFGLEAYKTMLAELSWRINIAAEALHPPTDPTVIVAQGTTVRTYDTPVTATIQYASVVSMDASSANVFYLTLLGDCTINAPVSGVDGEHITLELTSNDYSVTWGEGWNFGSAGVPTLTPDKTDIISGVYRAPATEWRAGSTSGF